MRETIGVEPFAGSTAEAVAVDSVAGVGNIQLLKVVVGAEGEARDITDADGFPVKAATLPLPAGAATEATLASLATALGVAGSPSSTVGLRVFGRRHDSDVGLADVDGDDAPLAVNRRGRLKVSAEPAVAALVSGQITASGQTVFVATENQSNVMMHMVAAGLSGHNCAFEGSLDSTDGTDGNWFGLQAARSNANTVETSTGVLAATPAYAWELSVNGLSFVRVRATAHTAGTATWNLQVAPFATEPIPIAQTHSVNVQASVGYGAATHHKAVSAATTNATSVKTSNGSINAIVASNTSASWRYLKIYNKSSAPVVGTDTPVGTIGIPPGQTVVVPGGFQVRLGTGIAYAITGGAADNDATAIGAGEVVLYVNYT